MISSTLQPFGFDMPAIRKLQNGMAAVSACYVLKMCTCSCVLQGLMTVALEFYLLLIYCILFLMACMFRLGFLSSVFANLSQGLSEGIATVFTLCLVY